MKDLKGKVAIVTGGASGIGKTISLAFAEAGATVVIPDVDAEGAEDTSREIKRLGQKSFSIESDVANPDHVDLIFDNTLDEYGKIDILVNNAGTTHPAVSILDLDLEYVDRIFSVDFKGVYLCSRRAGREMIRQNNGCIMNISSIAGRKASPGMGVYGIAKAAVEMFTRVLASELAPFNIRVNAVAPAMVRTAFSEPFWSNEDILREIVKTIPLGRIAEPMDVVHPTLFLASEASAYITGQTVVVDGGASVI